MKWYIQGKGSLITIQEKDLIDALKGAKCYGTSNYEEFKSRWIDRFYGIPRMVVEFAPFHLDNIDEMLRQVQSGNTFGIRTEAGDCYGFGIGAMCAGQGYGTIKAEEESVIFV